MKHALFLSTVSLLLAVTASATWAQQIYRCVVPGAGAPEYINNVKDAQTRNCKPVSGGNVTVVQGMPLSKGPARVAAATASSGQRSEGSAEQRSRDSDTRGILEEELKKAEAKLVEQQKEYNNGEPEKQGIEGRNYQRYLDRVAELKDGIVRNQSDIAGIKREISRLPTAH
ncbi:MAG: hypothetical protein HHJ16_00225 [Polaromonas sp.]|uniref:hypothetical protein n=1 Tax=Polaromonas sp. TaxID=1869339 RepID=UPI0017F251CE|nr:hypothetical protein [Polaromonas sp.]NMM08690.1 hypothetical protein [Polaromonas sp.]